MDAVRAFFSKIKALIFDFHERAGEASHPSPHSCVPVFRNKTQIIKLV